MEIGWKTAFFKQIYFYRQFCVFDLHLLSVGIKGDFVCRMWR